MCVLLLYAVRGESLKEGELILIGWDTATSEFLTPILYCMKGGIPNHRVEWYSAITPHTPGSVLNVLDIFSFNPHMT